ncbi:MAG: VOC family protein [Gammaproteobacteria bacterium]|nr:VOC family protein [Gammaproteobacteria bacterium]
MITHVKLVSIVVTDQDKSLAFYTEKLGFKLIVDAPFDKTARWIELQPPQGQTRVVLLKVKPGDARLGSLTNIVFTSDDVEKTYFDLKVKGVRFKEPPNKQPWGLFTQFTDPDGNVFVLASQ